MAGKEKQAQPQSAISKNQEYAIKGYASMRGQHPDQGSLFPDERPPLRKLETWHDLSEKHQQMAVEKTGMTLDQLTDVAGQHIDLAFAAAHQVTPQAPRIHAAGQEFYVGPSRQRSENATLAQRHGVPFHVVTAVRGAIAMNLPEEKEAHVVGQVLTQAKAGVPREQVRSSGITKAAQAGSEIVRHHTEGSDLDPTEIPAAPGSHNRAIGGHKLPGYYQSQAYPEHPDTRTAQDRWMFRALLQHKSDEENSELQKTRAKDRGKTVHPVHALLDEATRRAAQARGLDPVEAQAVIWERKRSGADKASPNVNHNQFRLFE